MEMVCHWIPSSAVNDLCNSDLQGTFVAALVPQLGDFDSAEYCEQLAAVFQDLKQANVGLRLIGIGEIQAAERLSEFTGLPLE
eukprot:scaffold549577_cov48-Prasinocladus_malaysianus.AAC.1